MAAFLRLRHRLVAVGFNARIVQSPRPEVRTVLVGKRQKRQHFRISGMAVFQRGGLGFCILGNRLGWELVDLAPSGQFPDCSAVGHAPETCVQRDAVAAGVAEIAAVHVPVRVQTQMVLSRPVVAAEGAGSLDLRPPERPAVEDQPTPSGRVHDGDSHISGQFDRPLAWFLVLLLYAACFMACSCPWIFTDSSALWTHFAIITCPVGWTL